MRMSSNVEVDDLEDEEAEDTERLGAGIKMGPVLKRRSIPSGGRLKICGGCRHGGRMYDTLLMVGNASTSAVLGSTPILRRMAQKGRMPLGLRLDWVPISFAWLEGCRLEEAKVEGRPDRIYRRVGNCGAQPSHTVHGRSTSGHCRHNLTQAHHCSIRFSLPFSSFCSAKASLPYQRQYVTR